MCYDVAHAADRGARAAPAREHLGTTGRGGRDPRGDRSGTAGREAGSDPGRRARRRGARRRRPAPASARPALCAGAVAGGSPGRAESELSARRAARRRAMRAWYLDTSAFVKLVRVEPHSVELRRWLRARETVGDLIASSD